jgi:hypothetical protein
MRSGNIRRSKPSKKIVARAIAPQPRHPLVAERKRASAACPTSFVSVEAEHLNAELHAAFIFDRLFSHMAKDDFAEIQRKLEAITSELKTATNPDRRRTLLREMSRLVAEAERISSQPPKMNHKPGQP